MNKLDLIANAIEEELGKPNPDETSLLEIFERLKEEAFGADISYYYYLLGYVLFNCPSSIEERKVEAIHYFQESVRLDDSYDFAKYYLAFLLFDSSDFEQALSTFLSIETDFFSAIDQSWRKFKVEEMIFVCHLNLTNDNRQISETIKCGVELFNQLAEQEEVGTYNYPVDLIRSSYSLAQKLGDPSVDFYGLIKLIEKLGIADQYQTELDLFRRKSA